MVIAAGVAGTASVSRLCAATLWRNNTVLIRPSSRECRGRHEAGSAFLAVGLTARSVSCCGPGACRRRARPGAGLEGIDKDHRAATAGARIRERWRLIVIAVILGLVLARRHMEQVSGKV